MASSIKQQLQKFINFLRGSQFPVSSPVFGKAMQFVYLLKQHPSEFSVKEIKDLRQAVQRSFQLSDQDLDLALSGISVEELENSKPQFSMAAETEDELWSLLPSKGFLHDYCMYTKNHEAPLAYHVFSALAGIGAVANNRVWYNMGYYKLYPAIGIILLGPSGLKKSTAADVMADMLQEWQYCNVYSEKFTPEYLLAEVASNPTGLLFARELSSVLGKQRYMEGIVPQLTRLMDHKTYVTGTKSGGRVVITDPAPSFIGCTTPDWFVSNTPADTFGGGFVARLIIVAQDDSPRVEPSPGRDASGHLIGIDPSLKDKLQLYLGNVLNLSGEVQFTPQAYKCYDEWYRKSKPIWKNPEVPLLATYYQRKHDHVKRVAMCIHLADHQDLLLCHTCFETAVKIMDWIERFIAPVYREMFKTASGVDNELVLKSIRNAGGVISHSHLTRAVQYRMDASRLKVVLQGLKESQVIEERHDKIQHVYLILG